MKSLGYYKFRGERVIGILQRAVSLFTLMGVMTVAEWSLWWLVLLIPAFLVVWFIDKHLLYPGEASAATLENPVMVDILKTLENIDAKM